MILKSHFHQYDTEVLHIGGKRPATDFIKEESDKKSLEELISDCLSTMGELYKSMYPYRDHSLFNNETYVPLNDNRGLGGQYRRNIHSRNISKKEREIHIKFGNPTHLIPVCISTKSIYHNRFTQQESDLDYGQLEYCKIKP